MNLATTLRPWCLSPRWLEGNCEDSEHVWAYGWTCLSIWVQYSTLCGSCLPGSQVWHHSEGLHRLPSPQVLQNHMGGMYSILGGLKWGDTITGYRQWEMNSCQRQYWTRTFWHIKRGGYHIWAHFSPKWGWTSSPQIDTSAYDMDIMRSMCRVCPEIETGQYQGIDEKDWTCRVCGTGAVENEAHRPMLVWLN